MRNAIMKFIETHQHASFVELCNMIPGFEGDKIWYLDHGILLWDGCSEEAIETMIPLMMSGAISFTVAHPLVYIIDGFLPSYPIAKSPTKVYKKYHWLPVTFSVCN